MFLTEGKAYRYVLISFPSSNNEKEANFILFSRFVESNAG